MTGLCRWKRGKKGDQRNVRDRNQASQVVDFEKSSTLPACGLVLGLARDRTVIKEIRDVPSKAASSTDYRNLPVLFPARTPVKCSATQRPHGQSTNLRLVFKVSQQGWFRELAFSRLRFASVTPAP